MSPQKLKIKKMEKLTDDTAVLSLEMPKEFLFRGGNWILLNTGIFDEEGKNIKRAYSIISSDEDPGQIILAVYKKPEGIASHFLNDVITEGAELEFGGPYGKNFFIQNQDPSGNLILIASDTGLTAILGILNSRECRRFAGSIEVIWLAEEGCNFLTEDFVLNHIPEKLKVRFSKITISLQEDPIRYRTVRDAITDAVHEVTPDLAFVSGDGYAVRIIKEVLQIYGMNEELIRTEPFFNTDMKKVIPKDPAYLRTGYTTGACSAAAAKAAVRALIQEKKMTRIESVLPNGKKVIFPVKRCEIRNQSALCSVVKDAGDDPDCTHLAELTAEVKLNDTGEITLSGGEGVAEVTLPGLGISVGEPSITEIPRKNIIEMVKSELGVTKLGADITISVPDGEERAKKTTNERLGLLGGISILGTSGIVKPYSTAAYRKSIIQSIYVAYEKGIRELAFTTGGKTEFYAMENLKHLRQESFIQVGDFIGTGLRNAFKKGISLIYIFGMIGKLSKMADGVIQTHQKGSDVNMQMLADAALSAGFPEEKVQKILESTTARNVLDLAREENLEKELSCEICRRVVVFMTNYASGIPVSEIKQELIPERTRDFQIRCTLIDFNGEILGEYPEV